MTPSQLRQWSLHNSQSDQWWLSLDAVTEELPVSTAEIERLIGTADYARAQVLHVSQAEIANPTWIYVTMPAALGAPPTITTATAALSTFRASGAKQIEPFHAGFPIFATIIATCILLFALRNMNLVILLLVIVLAVFTILVIYGNSIESKKRASMNSEDLKKYDEMRATMAVESAEASRWGQLNPKMICQHCKSVGKIRTQLIEQKKGISGAKATGALLTGGFSILATGLSRKEQCTQAHCVECGSTWTF